MLSPFEELNNSKLLLFFEPEPNSDKLQQIMLTKEQVLKVKEFVSKEVLKTLESDGDTFTVTCDDDVQIYVENCKEYYSQEEIDEE